MQQLIHFFGDVISLLMSLGTALLPDYGSILVLIVVSKWSKPMLHGLMVSMMVIEATAYTSGVIFLVSYLGQV
jgi:hypothetical protein